MSQAEFTDFEIEQDFNEVKEWGGEFSLVPPGDYTLLVTNLEQKPGDKAPYVAVTFEVQDEGDYKGQKVFNNYSFSDKAQGRVKQLMVACGAQLDKFRASQIHGATIRATVIHTEGAARTDENGNVLPSKTFANVINELPLDDQPAAPVEKPPVQRAQRQAAPAQNSAPPPVQNRAQPQRNGAARRT